MKNKLFICTALWIVFASCDNAAQQQKESVSMSDAVTFKLTVLAAPVISPVYLTHAADGSGRLFFLEQHGRIRIIKNGNLIEKPFLDISSKIVSQSNTYSERGLLGLAFHPDYKNNGKFYVYYSAPSQGRGDNHTSVISEFKVSSNPDIADTKERVIMTFGQPESNHNGGQLLFGKDGYLYIGSGDGGGGGDKHGIMGNAQDLSNLLGKILRVDINGKEPYTIPADNPFVGKSKNARGEIWAYGLRNPWRFSVDKETGTMYCGDVGQNKYEEINIIEKGGNYGWRKYEGFHVYDEDMVLPEDKVIMPIHEYSHDVGNSICGGVVYRGKNKDFNGKYIFGDWSGKLFYLQQVENKWERVVPVIKGLKEGTTLNNIGEGEDGEIYVLVQEQVGPNKKGGIIYKLEIIGK
ncbi:MAG TPA: PQQ-dependent sugar dehydrogenase [Cytophagaceae bacterium]